MEISAFEIEGPLLITPKVFHDDRGYFYESYNETQMLANGIPYKFLQDNQSCSRKGVLRGLHFQAPPFEQGKLVRVIRGSVLDVAVDIRKSSPTYGQYIGVTLSEVNQKMLWIPPGFAHGFLSLEEDTIFLYKCTNVYDKASEGGLIWNDPDLRIDWGITDPLVSPRDLELPALHQFNSPFS